MLKELRTEFKRISSTTMDLKSFGIVMGCFFSIIAGIRLWKGHDGLAPWLIVSALFFIAAFVRPSILLPLQRPWMMLALILGAIMSRVILTLLYFFILTPISLLARATGKKFLDLDFKKPEDSYWNFRSEAELSKPKESYEKQY